MTSTLRAPNRACVEVAVRAGLRAADLDIAVQPRAGRRKKLLVADMESTIITRELLDELAALVGLGAPVAAITGAACAVRLISPSRCASASPCWPVSRLACWNAWRR